MTKTLLSGPAVEPVPLADAKAHLRLDTSDEDAVVGAMIGAARVAVETDIRQVLIAQQWRVSDIAWPADRHIALPVLPVISVDAVRALDGANNPTILPAPDYSLDQENAVVTIEAGAAAFAPSLSAGGYEIDFTAGFGATNLDVPHALRQAILMLVTHWFENRSAVTLNDAPVATPEGVHALLAPWRRMSLC